MANPLKGEVALPPLPVPGFERGGTIRLDFNALCTIEGEFGAVEDAGERALTDLAPLRGIYRAALSEHHGDVGDERAGEIVQALGAEQARWLAVEAFRLSFPEAASGGDADPLTRAEADGTSPAAVKSGPK